MAAHNARQGASVVQATRSIVRQDRATFLRIVVALVALQVLTWVYHGHRTEQLEDQAYQLQRELDQANDELREAQLHPARYYGPQD